MRALFLFTILAMASCKQPESIEPIKVTKLTKVYSIQVQQNGNTWNPQFLPNIGNGK